MSGITHLLIHTGSVTRKSYTSDSQGGFTYSYITAVASFPCRISRTGTSNRVVADQEQGIATHTIYALSGLDVKKEDIIVALNDSYEVLGIAKPSIRDSHIEISCRRFEAGQ